MRRRRGSPSRPGHGRRGIRKSPTSTSTAMVALVSCQRSRTTFTMSCSMDETKMPAGGTFYAFRARVRGTRKTDFLIRGSANGSTWYFYEWDSDAPAYVTGIGSTSVGFPIMFDRAVLAPRSGVGNGFDIAAAQGPFFLYSKLVRVGIQIGRSDLSQGYAIKMASDVTEGAATEM